MTVRIADLTAQFANSAITYVGVGLHVIDAGSAPESKMLNMSVNSNNKFSISKDGTVEINGYMPDSYKLFIINERDHNLVSVTNNVAAMNTTTYVKTYAEGYIDVGNDTTKDLTFDLSKASVFGTTANQINSISFVIPNTLHGKQEAYSCSVVFYRPPWFGPSDIWTQAGVKWAYGSPPRFIPDSFETGPTILTFLNINTDPDIWYAAISGIDFVFYSE